MGSLEGWESSGDDGDGGNTAMRMCLMPLNHAVRMVKIVDFTLRIFHRKETNYLVNLQKKVLRFPRL